MLVVTRAPAFRIVPAPIRQSDPSVACGMDQHGGLQVPVGELVVRSGRVPSPSPIAITKRAPCGADVVRAEAHGVPTLQEFVVATAVVDESDELECRPVVG